MSTKYIRAKEDEEEKVKVKPTKFQKKLNFLYNKRTGQICGRTGLNWCKLILYFLFFYIVLCAFFFLMIYIFMNKIISPTTPFRTGMNSILTFTPGVNANPRISIESGLILATSNKSNPIFTQYLSAVNKFFLKTFPNLQNSSTSSNCTDNRTPANISNFCIFNTSLLGPCADPKHELLSGRLCVYIKVNKIYGWLPMIVDPNLSNDTFVHCDGQGKPDANNLGRPMYYPGINVGNITYGVIPNMHFPFINQKDYYSPTVAVQFPEMSKNIAIMIQCSLRNIKNSYKPIKFEIMLMSK